jgi:hypothetical protein
MRATGKAESIRGWQRLLLWVVVFSFFSPGSIFAARIVIDAPSKIDLGGGLIMLDCGDMVVDGELSLGTATVSGARHVTTTGTLNGDSGTIQMAGNWSNSGTVDPGSSAVEVSDGCALGISNFSGDTSFHDLSITTTGGKQLNLTANSAQKMANSLTLTGAAGNLLTIRSTSFGTPAFLELDGGGTQLISYVDVQDNHAPLPGQLLAPGAPSGFNSTDSGGNDRWFITGDYIFSDSFEDMVRRGSE